MDLPGFEALSLGSLNSLDTRPTDFQTYVSRKRKQKFRRLQRSAPIWSYASQGCGTPLVGVSVGNEPRPSGGDLRPNRHAIKEEHCKISGAQHFKGLQDFKHPKPGPKPKANPKSEIFPTLAPVSPKKRNGKYIELSGKSQANPKPKLAPKSKANPKSEFVWKAKVHPKPQLASQTNPKPFVSKQELDALIGEFKPIAFNCQHLS